MNHYKTIRTEVFETNSSSTHSVTIQNINEIPNAAETLVVDNILYADRLSTYVVEVSDSYTHLKCVTFDQKAALVAHWIFSLEYYITNEELHLLFEYYKEKLPYKNIIITSSEFYPYNDYGNNYLHNDDNLYPQIDILIKYIYDDSIEIIDSTEED